MQNAAEKIPWRKRKKLPKPKANEKVTGRRMKSVIGLELWRKDETLRGWKGYLPKHPGYYRVARVIRWRVSRILKRLELKLRVEVLLNSLSSRSMKRLELMRRNGVSLNLLLSKSMLRLELKLRGGVPLNLVMSKSLKRLELKPRGGVLLNSLLSKSMKRLELKLRGGLRRVRKPQLFDWLIIVIPMRLDHRRLRIVLFQMC